MKSQIKSQISEKPTRHALPAHVRLTPEFRLVAACSWLPESGHASRQNEIIDSLSNCELNWDEVASLVLRHDVVGQFCTVMGKRGWINVPVEIRERLKIKRTQQVVRALGQVAELVRVARLLAEVGIPLIPLKGVALSQELYGDPCVRSSCDLDIIVKHDDVERAEEHLIQAGYRCAFVFHGMQKRQKRAMMDTVNHLTFINETNNTHLELHWKSQFWSQEHIAALWESSRSATWLDAGLTQLSTEENIIFLADHVARHGWFCLKWLSDLAMLMQNMTEDEWLSFYNRAGYFDQQRVICVNATLLEWFYGIKQPHAFRELSTAFSVVQKLSIKAASQLLASEDELASRSEKFLGPRRALQIKKLKPLTPLSEILKEIIITTSDFTELPLPDRLFWLYFPLRPYFWFRRHYLKKSLS